MCCFIIIIIIPDIGLSHFSWKIKWTLIQEHDSNVCTLFMWWLTIQKLSCLIQTIFPCDETHCDHFNWLCVVHKMSGNHNSLQMRSQFALFLQAAHYNRRNKPNLSKRRGYIWHLQLKLRVITLLPVGQLIIFLFRLIFWCLWQAVLLAADSSTQSSNTHLQHLYFCPLHFLHCRCALCYWTLSKLCSTYLISQHEPDLLHTSVYGPDSCMSNIFGQHWASPICHSIPGELNLWLQCQRLLWETHKVKDGVATQVSFVHTGWVMW